MPERQHRGVARAALGRERRARQTGHDAGGGMHLRGLDAGTEGSRNQVATAGRKRGEIRADVADDDAVWQAVRTVLDAIELRARADERAASGT